MRKPMLRAAILLIATALNLLLFIRRWADLPLGGVPQLLSEHSTASLLIGVVIASAALNLLGHLLGRRWFSFIVLLAASCLFISWTTRIRSFSLIFPLATKFAFGGAILAALCLRVRENEPQPLKPLRTASFALYFLASLNFFLMVAPFTTFTPAYIQDGISPAPSLSYFYYGSIHSNISMVSVFMRKIINAFFDYPSINATILSSMILVSIGLASVALAFELLFGRPWGWMILLAAWTDRYLLAGGIASSVVSMPIFSAGSVFLLCIWSLTRRRGILDWKETLALSVFNSVSLLFSLYSYSAARIPWLVGSIIAATTLITRGALPLNVNGIKRAVATIVPSVVLVVAILVLYFDSNLIRFKAQLFISPTKDSIIRDVVNYPGKVIPIHDADVPIWWGTGRVEGVNLSLYWIRSPREIYQKVKWFMGEIGQSSPVAPYLLALSGLSFIILSCSSYALWRKLAFVSFLSLIGSFAPFILAQDPAAYRRALATNLLLMVPIVGIFAIQRRRGLLNILSAGLCATFCLVKAPLEWAPLFSTALHSPLCIACHDQFDVRALVNDPVYQGTRDRPLIFTLDGSNIAVVYAQCAVMAIDSHEMKALSPNTRHIRIGGRTVEDTFKSLSVGEILVVTCPTSAAPEGEMSAICAGTPPFGKVLGSIKDPSNIFQPRTKWVFIEKSQ